MLNGLRDWIANLIIEIMKMEVVKPQDYLTFSPEEAAIVTDIWNKIAPLGMSLLLVYFFLELNKTIFNLGDSFSLRAMVAPFVKFGVGAIFIAYGAELVSAVFGFNNGVIQWGGQLWSSSSPEANSAVEQSIRDKMKEQGLGQLIGMLVLSIIPKLLSGLAKIVIMYQAVSIKLEMILRGGAMPLALGDVYEGKQSNAVRNVKKLMALGVAGFLMVCLCKVGNLVNLTFLDTAMKNLNVADLFGFALQCVVVPLAVAGMCGTCKQIANDLMGC